MLPLVLEEVGPGIREIMLPVSGWVEGHVRERLASQCFILFLEHEAHALQVPSRFTPHHVLCRFIRPLGD